MSNQHNIKLLNSLLEQSVEHECLEFKAAKNHFDADSLGRYVTALANEALDRNEKEAWLVFGVHDKTHEVVGTQCCNTIEKQNEAKLSLAQSMQPQLQVDFINVDYLNGKNAVMVKIPRPVRAVSWKGHYYHRNGESIGPMNIEKVNRLGTPVDWSSLPCDGATLESLDTNAIAVGRDNFKIRHPELADLVDGWSDEEFLSRLRVIVRGKISNAGVILFGRPESDALLSPASSRITWILRDRTGLPVSHEHFFCPLILSADKAIAQIRNLKYSHLEVGSMFPNEVYRYDPWILREAMANAIAHQDYSLSQHITIVELESGDQVTFSNAGSFIPGTIEEVLQSIEPERYVRNRSLVHAMIEVRLMENVNSGIPKMFKIQRERLFPMPEYEIADNHVQVSVIGKVTDPNYAESLAHDDRLELIDLFLLDRLRKNKSLTQLQIQHLRDKGLISGRAPYRYISVAGKSDDFIAEHFFNDNRLKEALLEYLKEHNTMGATRSSILSALDGILPSRFSETQKSNKIKNLLQDLRKQDLVELKYRSWFIKN